VLFCRYSTGGRVRVTRFFVGGSSALAARATGLTFARSSCADWAFGIASRTRSDAMSGAGAGAVVRFRIVSGLESGCQGVGRPTRLLVTIGGELGSSVASATNSSAISAKPATARKMRAGIAAFQHDPSTRSNLGQTVAIGRVGPRYNRFYPSTGASENRQKRDRAEGGSTRSPRCTHIRFILSAQAHVRFGPKADIPLCRI
jgi:hypothetical protein